MILKICVNDGFRYLETKDFQVLTFKKGEEPFGDFFGFKHIESNIQPEEQKHTTILFLENENYYLIDGELNGYVLNDKGQTVERL